MSGLACQQCDLLIEEAWMTLIVTEDSGEVTAGHLCGLNCLVDYTATVFAKLIDLPGGTQ
jgi:hypothetical protein